LTTRTALQIISERPLSGTGFSQFLAMSAPLLEGKSKYFKEPVHNIYLLIAAEAGITALAAFVWFLARAIPLRRLRDTEAITPFAIALLLLVIGMFDLYPLATHAGAWLLFLPLALLARHTPAHHRVPA
jgi:O-antigen ligase